MEEYVRQVNTNIELSQEIERLNKELNKFRYTPKVHFKETMKLRDRINKAIEYIESYMPNYDFDKTNLIKLLEILQGSDKE